MHGNEMGRCRCSEVMGTDGQGCIVCMYVGSAVLNLDCVFSVKESECVCVRSLYNT